jgi:hypothetical protein
MNQSTLKRNFWSVVKVAALLFLWLRFLLKSITFYGISRDVQSVGSPAMQVKFNILIGPLPIV